MSEQPAAPPLDEPTPEATDNSPRPEDGEQDVPQTPEPLTEEM